MLAVHHVFKTYTEAVVLHDLSLRVAPNKIVALLGPSGCGKSTLLRIIAGLETADSGSITFAGEPIDTVPTHARNVGLMFQDYALFPHLDVAANIAFGLHSQHANRTTINQRVAELLDLVGLAGYATRRVDRLSGGERQRVALARSLAPNPRLLMLDEPLGALDRGLRERLLDELRTILKQVNLTSIYVTHDQAEAFALADHLVLMNAGRIVQQGTPEQVYRQPANSFVARFLGLTNLIPATIVATDSTSTLLDTALGRLRANTSHCIAGMQIIAVLPSSVIQVVVGNENQIHGVLQERTFRGSTTRIALATAHSEPLYFDVDGRNLPELGAPLTLAIAAADISVVSA